MPHNASTTSGAQEDSRAAKVPKAIDTLHGGAVFVGEQRSGRNTYDVKVELQHVDLKQSSLCGYLKIRGLTEEFPELTTFFEGEIIGPKFSFLTRKWDADELIDKQHWARFPSFKPLMQHLSSPHFTYNPLSSRYIYMRWKETFLVPNWKTTAINGASFAGFYYICFDRVSRTFDGYYYHRNSEFFQRLCLNFVEERGLGVFDFR